MQRRESDYDYESSGYTQRDAGDIQESARDMGERGKQRAQEIGEKAKERAEAGRERAAGGLESAAGQMRERAEAGEGMTAQVGTKVADQMERTAGYLREHDTSQIFDDVEEYVREHPMQALAGAVVGGFLIGRMLR
jgi:ElaB/YqjD/DUF883 family membrane-anchored ribosome-binding protein